jgi:hypothetical protein
MGVTEGFRFVFLKEIHEQIRTSTVPCDKLLIYN